MASGNVEDKETIRNEGNVEDQDPGKEVGFFSNERTKFAGENLFSLYY